MVVVVGVEEEVEVEEVVEEVVVAVVVAVAAVVALVIVAVVSRSCCKLVPLHLFAVCFCVARHGDPGSPAGISAAPLR